MTSSLGYQAGFRVVREALGVPIRDAAARIGITNTTMNRFERGERRMYLHQAATLAELYDVPLDMLIREPTVDDLLVLRDKWLRSKEPAAAPILLPRPQMVANKGGVSETRRPYTDDELRQMGKDPALYEALPLDVHQPEINAMAAAGASMGETPATPASEVAPPPGQPTIEELMKDWDHGDE